MQIKRGIIKAVLFLFNDVVIELTRNVNKPLRLKRFSKF